MRSNDLFDQIRFIDANGMERLRVDGGEAGNEQSDAFVVPDRELQFKGDTYYFRQSMALDAQSIYISPLDLNMEHGKVQRPFKPVIRFGLKILRPDGKPAGILMINHKAQNMLDRFVRVGAPIGGETMLINHEGYWLSHPDPDKEWGFMFADRKHLTLAKTDPSLWQRLLLNDNARFEHGGDMVTFTTVHPFQSFSSLHHFQVPVRYRHAWKIVSIFPATALAEAVNPVKQRVLAVALLIWLFSIVLIVVLLRARKQRMFHAAQIQLRNQAIEQSAMGVVVCDVQQPDDPIVYCNSAFEKLSGYTRDEVLGLNCRFMQGNDSDQEQVSELSKAIAERRSCQVTVKNYRKDGSCFWNQITISPVYSSNGSVSHYLGSLLDVSERKQSEEERAELLQQVQTLSRELMQARELERAEITRTLHDEFGQVITAIRIQAELSDQQCQSRNCDGALESIHKLEQFAEHLMDSTRTVINQLKPGHLQELGLFESVVELCKEWQHSSGIDFDVCLQDGLQDGLDDGVMPEMTERSNIQLYRIVQESITNIVRHSGATHGKVDFNFKANRLKLTIQDDGCGFDLHHISIGSGLTSMRERARLLGGNLEVSISPEGGSMLVFRIPVSILKKNP